MISHSTRPVPGTVALLGSGEYLDVMNDVDTYLLETLGGASTARGALIPTASGLEPNGPTLWNNLGRSHFEKLGVKDIRSAQIMNRDGAADPQQLALLQDADLYYFSGGNPQHIIEVLRDSPTWNIIKGAYEQGAALAGCSAGAMMLSGHTLSLRQVMMGKEIEYVDVLGIVPHLIVFPHFDRMSGFLDQNRFQSLLHTIPKNHTVVGIDEDTALVRVASNGPTAQWRVMGRQTVKVFEGDRNPRIIQAGDEVTLVDTYVFHTSDDGS